MRTIFLLTLLLGLTSCGSVGTRQLTSAAAGAGAGAIAHQATDGDILATTGAAAGGVLVSEILHSNAQKRSVKDYNRGYDRGSSDAVKKTYEIVQSAHQPRTTEHDRVKTVLYPVQGPETYNGANREPHTIRVAVDE